MRDRERPEKEMTVIHIWNGNDPWFAGKKQFLTAANALGGNPDTLPVALPRDRASAP